MRIKNYTDIDTDTLREIIRFVKPAGVSNFDVSFKNCAHAFRGRAYAQGCSYHDTAAPLVIVSIGKKELYPRKGGHKPEGGYLPIPDLYSKIEAVVLVTAHELRHLWQAKHPRGWRVWGSRGQFSERDADAYALRMLRAWRTR
jgi:hypothetical protein